jgi:hypothetical protein
MTRFAIPDTGRIPTVHDDRGDKHADHSWTDHEDPGGLPVCELMDIHQHSL